MSVITSRYTRVPYCFPVSCIINVFFYLQSTEENRKNTERLKTGDNRLLKLTEEATKLRELNRKRNLPERDQLNKQLIAATRTLHEKEKEVAELKRRIGILEKALKQQVQAEVGRHRATARKLYNLQCDHHELQEILKVPPHFLN
ncbi:hypothetical protein E2C01_087291 [Portunus trituberculatus]|uniref:Lebercilin domain-containing protein n=1 Tax=Portunus trituberculatus TaxID=210409 RepID=A0A5B7JC29_PORTR|nr:hypothetical protein [Portunus trituberculatus]